MEIEEIPFRNTHTNTYTDLTIPISMRQNRYIFTTRAQTQMEIINALR